MLKKILYIVIAAVLSVSCDEDPRISQSQEDFQLKVFGGSTVGVLANDCCNAVLVDGENLFLTGSISYQNGPDMFLIKTDKYGNEIEWSPKLFGSGYLEVGNALAIDKNKNVVTAGYIQPTLSESSDFYVVKTGPGGEEVWKKSFGGSRDEKAYSVNITSTNTIYVAGYTESNAFDIKKRQGWVLALSENGDSLWSHDYGTLGITDELRSIADMRDSLILVGTTQTLFGNYKNDVFLFILKKSTKGIENSATLYRAGDETGVSAAYAPTGNVFVLGYTQISPGVNNIVVWKLSENLQLLTEKSITVSNSETPSALILSGNNLVIVGTTTNDQQISNNLVYVLDPNLNILSRNTYGTQGRGSQKGVSGAVVGNSVIIGGCTVSGNTSKASIYRTPPILP